LAALAKAAEGRRRFGPAGRRALRPPADAQHLGV